MTNNPNQPVRIPDEMHPEIITLLGKIRHYGWGPISMCADDILNRIRNAPVDPDLAMLREELAKGCTAKGWPEIAAQYLSGERDNDPEVQAGLAIAKRVRGEMS